MTSENTFKEDIKQFKHINAEEAAQKLEKEDKAIVFIGRETCPYCRKFAKKLSSIYEKINGTIYFVNSEDTSDTYLSSLREQYSVVTVPGFLVGRKGNVEVKCDSSMSEEQILDMTK